MHQLSQLLAQSPQTPLWLVVVDVALVAILIYKFLTLIRGTRAMPMMMGVGFLAALFYVAH
ncbi:MAG TPA: TIGR00159 family protein, partial [candidate division Zixibacteria bacterium]|nr:TIGR00159 family protein [candidate division Zixibacteria bacterium]